MKRTGFLCQIKASEENQDEAEILIYDDIGRDWFGEGVTAKKMVQDLAALKAKTITVRINSGGGDVFEGLTIYNALKRHDAKVITEVDGLAASIASVIALAGEEIRMAENAFFMIHNPHSIAWGDANEMRAMAKLLDKVGGSLANVYVAATGEDLKTVQDWMDAETWFTAKEAKEAGFVTSITEGKEVRACADLKAFGKVPSKLAQLMNEIEEEEDDDEEEETPPAPPAASEEEETEEDKKKAAAAAGDAAPDPVPPPAQPAGKAKGDSMSDKDTAAQTIAAERERGKQIRAIGATHKIDAEKVNSWIDEGKTVDQVNALVLEELRAAADRGPKTPRVGVRNRAENDPRYGFESQTDFLLAVIKNSGARSREEVREERLRPLAVLDEGEDSRDGLSFTLPRGFAPRSIRAAQGSDEQGTYADQYGGFLQQTEVKPGLLMIEPEADPTEGLVTNVPMGAPIVKFNARVDKNHASSVSGGLTFTRTPETVDGTSSRMKFQQVSLEAAPFVGIAHESEQLIQDSPISLAALLSAGFKSQRAAQLLKEKLFGVGGGQYMGVANASCTISVAKETNQVAATINSENVIKMAARLWGPGVWLANQSCKPQLYKLSLTIGTAGVPLYQPSPTAGFPDYLLGWPVFYTEHCKAVGTVGDIILGNWSQYLEGIYSPMRSDESIHVRFIALERTLRFYERNCAAPWWATALTPENGDTLSPFVTLATRA
jgi:ATP-dependent Clp protease, protease subunit